MGVWNLGTGVRRGSCGSLIRRCRDGDWKWFGRVVSKVKPFEGSTYVGEEFGKVKTDFEVDKVPSFEFAIDTAEAEVEFVVVGDLFTVVSEEFTVSSNSQGVDNGIDVGEVGCIGVIRSDFVFDFCDDFVVNKLDGVLFELMVRRVRFIEEFIERKVEAEERSPECMKVIDCRVFGEGYRNNVELGKVDFGPAGASGGNHDRR